MLNSYPAFLDRNLQKNGGVAGERKLAKDKRNRVQVTFTEPENTVGEAKDDIDNDTARRK